MPACWMGSVCESSARRSPRSARRIVAGLAASPIGQVLVERSLLGWYEIEFEVLRDASDTTIAICGMENLDPMGVHTGDSIVVAPIQTLPDPVVQRLRRCALKIVRALRLEGGCNVQLAVAPDGSDYRVIEVNPRVSRSSALASKATGYPIARVAALIALGRRLHELPNPATGGNSAAFEPAVDYVVVKLPRWPFDKFPSADRSLGVQMKATGEAMAIDREFGPALLKAVRSLEPRGRGWLWEDPAWGLADRPPEDLATLSGVPAVAVRRARVRAGIGPSYRRVDTCAGEFPAETPYFYSSYADPEVAPPAERRSVIVVGSGPIRIGQGIEFDYCSVRAAWAIREMGLDAVVVNNNPETVSTDYDACSRLYFEPLDTESVLDVIDHERALTGEPPHVVLTFGGQTAIDLARDLAYADVPIAGLTAEAIEITEDRERFADLMDRLGIEGPRGQLAVDSAGLAAAIEELGLPVIVRPSWVIGGRGIAVLHSIEDVAAYLATEVGWPLRVDELVAGTELDVDAISDGSHWCVPGILEQLEPPGVHSGDSVAVLPPQGVSREVQERAASVAGRIAMALGVRGILNVQMIAAGDGRIVVIEANPRASRTVPIVAKGTGLDVVAAAVRCALGASLADVGLAPGLRADGDKIAVKTPVGSLWRLPGVDATLGPEMRSTGEVLGLAADYATALADATEAAAVHAR